MNELIYYIDDDELVVYTQNKLICFNRHTRQSEIILEQPV